MSNPVPLRAATGVPKPLPDPRHQAAHDFLRQAMRLNIGRGRRFSAEQVGEALGVKVRLVEAIRDGEQEPRFGLGLAIAALLGDATVNGLLAIFAWGGARPLDDDDEAAKPFETLAAINATSATLATALADGRVDHRERPVCVQALRELSAVLDEQAADLERGA